MGKSTLRRLAWRLLMLSLLTSFVVLLSKERVAYADGWCAQNYYYCTINCGGPDPYGIWDYCMTGCDIGYIGCGGGGAPAPFPVSPGLSPWEQVFYNCTVIGVVPEQHAPELIECLTNGDPQDGCCFAVADHYPH